jgi:acetoacetyl-CoA synthetase
MSAPSAAPLWQPTPTEIGRAQVTRYRDWLAAERGVDLDGYEALWRWSVDELEGFWGSVWDYFGVVSDAGYDLVLESRTMPGARWFPGSRLNYAEHVFRDRRDDAVAIVHASESRDQAELTWGELRQEVARVAAGLRSLGVEEGDRVAAYLPNIVEAVIGFLATASLGAVWTSVSPDFGVEAVVDRFAQVEPKVLIGVDGYRYGGKDFPRTDVVGRLRAEIPGLEHCVMVRYLGGADVPEGFLPWENIGEATAELGFRRVEFSSPLWILYSSGTTGLPKAIVHSQGGILLEHLKKMHFQLDLGEGDRFFWFTTTGWMMWNVVVSGLLTKAAIVLFDGNPGYPDMESMWEFADRAGVTVFGTSAAFISASIKAGARPRRGRGLERLRAIGSTGSPLNAEGFDWIYEQFDERLWLFSTSGGSDVCTAFVGGVPTLPVYRGELQAPYLGVALAAFDEDGESVSGTVAELVVTEPMPSMPVYLWGDEDGSRYRDAYFDVFPGVWRHGDWIEITERGGAVIYGRSDATINRGGVRMGSAEIYRALDQVDGVLESIVVDLHREGDGWIALFVVPAPGAVLDDDLRAAIKRAIRTGCSPRHVPDAIHAVPALPRTLSGKLLEVPVKRILEGEDPSTVVSPDALVDPTALRPFIDLASEPASPGAI